MRCKVFPFALIINNAFVKVNSFDCNVQHLRDSFSVETWNNVHCMVLRPITNSQTILKIVKFIYFYLREISILIIIFVNHTFNVD